MAFLQVVVNQKLLNQDVKNILCFAGSGATIANGQAFADALRDIYLDELTGELHPSWSMESVTLYDFEAATGTPGQTFVPALGPIVGVASGNPLPTQVSALLRFRATDGPPWLGRAFFGGFALNTIDSQGVFNNDAVAAMQAWGDRLLSFSLDTGIAAAHVMIRGGRTNFIGDDVGTVTTYEPVAIPSTQRRRKIGVGS